MESNYASIHPNTLKMITEAEKQIKQQTGESVVLVAYEPSKNSEVNAHVNHPSNYKKAF